MVTASLLAGCAGDAAYTAPLLTYEPCAAVVAVHPDATPEQLESVEAALALWNEAAGLDLGRADWDDPDAIPLRFEDAAPLFMGLYDDEAGVIYINERLTDPSERTITVAHELGHAFGLAHVRDDERSSLMNIGNVHTGPTTEDVAQVQEIWGGCER